MNSIVAHPITGGLSHLVEAATALASLNEFTSPTRFVQAHAPQTTQEPVSPVAPVVSDEEKPTVNTATTPSPSKREIFPQRLMAILSDSSLTDVVTWLPHGKSFVIIRPDVFTDTVLPKYLPPVDVRASTKYPSFTRKLNRWGFRQATRGPDTGAFHHPLFHRDDQYACLEMVCQRSRDRKSTDSSKLPPKKRACGKNMVSPLTKESLDAMSPAASQTQGQGQACLVATVSVTDDSRSVASSSNQQPGAPVVPQTPQPGITRDTDFAANVLLERDEQERVKVAKAMLFEAYMKALEVKK